jgi:GntR family transcriptional regulator, uxu operon transcriptional repressor
LIEGETAACAAQEGTDEELEEIAAAVREHARVDRSAPAADRAFHLAIARATHNGPLLAVVQMLWDQGRGAVWKQMEKHFETSALRASTLRDHQKILEAILAHDRRGARAAMHAHLERVELNFGQSLEPKAGTAKKKPKRKPKSR